MFKKKESKKSLLACFDGTSLPVSEVPDVVFSGEMLGKGIAISPKGDKVKLYMPADGKISSISETLHAFNILTDDGIELLIHVGVDTVELKGSPFEVVCKEGSHYTAGELLAKVDLEEIKRAEKPTVTPMVITNPEILDEITPVYTEVEGGKDAVIQYKTKR